MKKIIFSLLVAFMSLGLLVGCGEETPETPDEPKDPVVNPGESEGNKEEYPKLENITVEALEEYPVTDGKYFLYDISDSGNGIRVYDYTGTNDIVVIPEEINGKKVEQVAGYTFANDSFVRGVVIPETVTSLYETFINNTKIEVVIAKGVTDLGYATFCNCASLKYLILSDKLTTIGEAAISACEALIELYIPATLTQMDQNSKAMFLYLCDKVTIYGEAGSYIETVCQEKGIPFVAK